MIYLIDDKINRQISSNWNYARLDQHKIEIVTIYNSTDIERHREEIFSNPNNSVLFHESFFDNESSLRKKQSLAIREDLRAFADINKTFQVAFFSGAKQSQRLDGNIAYLPVEVLYTNLEHYIQSASDDHKDLKYLLFGESPDIEELLLAQLDNANASYDLLSIQGGQQIFMANVLSNELANPFVDSKKQTFLIDHKLYDSISDDYLHDLTLHWFEKDQFDHIFIPICFGDTLSDFNGLRLAMHIRCTPSINQFSNIHIYSFVDHTFLLNNQYYDILKTVNVNLIRHDHLSFKNALQKIIKPLDKGLLSEELNKVKLRIPTNYEDSHSINNEWALHRWSSALKIDDDKDIEQIQRKLTTNIYFKYLVTKTITKDQAAFQFVASNRQRRSNPKILLVDDEADKGWYEVVTTLLTSTLDFDQIDYIGKELLSLSQTEVIEATLGKIKQDKIEIVLLDFRLLRSDFDTTKIDQITGYKLLREIKNHNPGIQVIIFSATNKIWNLIDLQKIGADGFILKESPENSMVPNFTNETINEAIKTIEYASQRVFLIEVFNAYIKIRKNLDQCDIVDAHAYRNFVLDLKKQIKILESATSNIHLDNSTSLDIVFLNMYNFLEKFRNFYVQRPKYSYLLGIELDQLKRYGFEDGMVICLGDFNPENNSDKPSWFQSIAGLFIDYFLICPFNNPMVKDIGSVKTIRNDYIHNEKDKFNIKDLLLILDLCVIITQHMKE